MYFLHMYNIYITHENMKYHSKETQINDIKSFFLITLTVKKFLFEIIINAIITTI